MNDINLVEKLKEAGCHYGYSKSRRHPSAAPYIAQTRSRIDIFDLEKTAKLLEAATDFLKSVLSSGGQILFVGGKPEARDLIKQIAQELNQPYVAGRWIGGTLTNFSEIRKRIQRMNSLEKDLESGALAHHTKKERLQFERELNRLQEMFGGLKNMETLPKAVFIIDPAYESIAMKEATQMKIKTVAVANTDSYFTQIDFPIPANDTARKSLEFIVNYIKDQLLPLAGAKKESEKDNK